MKLSPTVTLALAFAAGIAGVAAAQNSPNSGTAPASPQTTAPNSAGSTSQAQPSQIQPAYGQAQLPNNANEQVRTAQQQLRTAGLYNGPVDGVMDPDTRAALARFQQQNGLQQTQSLDQETLARLMSGPPTGSEPNAPVAPGAAPSGSSGNAAAPAGAGGTPPGQAPGQATQR